MRSKTLYIIIGLVALTALVFVGASAASYDELYNRYADEDLTVVNDRGKRYYQTENPDSAVVCFNIVIQRYSPEMSNEGKHQVAAALNNKALVYNFFYNDYSESLRLLLRAQSIAEDSEFRRLMPYILLNRANIYAQYRDNRNAVEYYCRAFRQAIDVKDWDIAQITLNNAYDLAPTLEGDANLRKQLSQIDPSVIPQAQMDPFFAQRFKASKAMLTSDWPTMLEASRASLEKIGSRPDSLRFVASGRFYVAYAKYRLGNRRDAASDLHKLMEDMPRLPLEYKKDISLFMADMYASVPDSNQYYSQVATALTDSLFQTQHYGLIRDIQSAYEVEVVSEQMRWEQTQRKAMTRLLVVSGILCVIILGMCIIVIRKNRKLNLSNQALFERYEKSVAAEQAERELRRALQKQMEESMSESAPEASDTASHEEEPGEGSRQSLNMSELTRIRILNSVQDAMADEQVITTSGFSLNTLSHMAESNPTYVSAIINEVLGKNFATLLQEARIKVACRRLREPEYSNLTIEAIAEGTGFKSKSNFNRIFKKVTGLTPTDYRRINP